MRGPPVRLGGVDLWANAMDDLESRRRRARYRSWHRGTKEMDLLLGGFADRYVPTMDLDALDEFERLIGLPDPDLYRIYRRELALPAELSRPLLDLYMNFKIVK